MSERYGFTMPISSGGRVGFRFYKSVKLLPGVRLNFSKSGISTTLGVPGANMNLGRRGRRYTVGLPGSGLSYTETSSRARRGSRRGGELPTDGAPARGGWRWLIPIALLVMLCLLFV